MNKIIFLDGHIFNTVEYPIEVEPSILSKKQKIDNVLRDVVRITIESTYKDVSTYFVNNTTWAIRQFNVDENGNELETYTDIDYSEYSIASDIVDHRDGKFTIYMAKKTDNEIKIENLEKENAAFLYEKLTGKNYAE